MPIELSPLAYIEKNKLSSTGAWLIMLEIYITQLQDYIRVCSNNEDIVWNGSTWLAYPFEMDEISESSKGEITQFAIKVSNINGEVGSYIDDADGAVGADIRLMVVNSNIMATTPEIELNFIVKSTTVDTIWVSFTLGVTNPYSLLIGQRMIRTGCRYSGLNGTQNGFKGSRCKYSGGAESCDRTLTTCRSLGNSANFGGFPGLGLGNTFYA